MTPKAKTSKLPSLSLRIDLDQGRIGPGKIQLLETIHSCGSIAAAGRALNMSFKHAWDLVNDLNRICGCAVIEPEKGGKDGGRRIVAWRLSTALISLLACEYRALAA